MRIPIIVGAVLSLPLLAVAQQNLRPGTDVSLSNLGGVASPSGAHAGTFPNGMQSWGVSTTSCNVGSVNVPWLRDMNLDHPQIGMWIYREYQGRFEQISLFKGVKHGFTSTNSPGCGTCPGGAGTSLVIGCSDTYGASLNYSHTYVAPPSEINPWLGTWTSRGSHFDRGFPVQNAPFDTDDQRSAINFPSSNQGYRNQVLDSGLNVTGATFWVSAYYNVIGEPDLNRENNFATHQISATWNGSTWSWGTPNGTQYPTPALFRWSGASVNSANNNNGDDGRFYVAVKVTGPTNGLYHYEYAVFNRDNNRQGGAFRIPFCAGASVTNVSFRDPDQDANNDWTIAVNSAEVVITSPVGGGNNLTWGNLFNVSLDSDAAPATGVFSVDQANAGAGNASVDVSTSCPLDLRNLYLGAGCGSPSAPTLAANGAARLGNAAFALTTSGVASGASTFTVFSLADTNLSLGGGCTLFVDPALVFFGTSATADGAGIATVGVPVPNDPALDSATLAVQTVEFETSGAFGSLDLSNGLKVKLGNGNVGCN